MSTYPTATNGGLLLYVAVALVLVFLASQTGRPHGAHAGTTPKNNPGSALHHHDHRATGATTNTLQSQGAVMPDSTSTDPMLYDATARVLRLAGVLTDALDHGHHPGTDTITEQTMFDLAEAVHQRDALLAGEVSA